MVLFEASSPLMRIAWNPARPNILAAVARATPGVSIIDVRKPAIPCEELSFRGACVSSIAWHPVSGRYLVCGCDDGTAQIWEPKPGKPLLSYDSDWEVQQVVWPAASPMHVGLGLAQQVQLLSVA
jgi:WD40 repeat protein